MIDKSQLVIDKSEEIRRRVISDLRILEATWGPNSPAGCGVRQALSYLLPMDFTESPVCEHWQDFRRCRKEGN